MPCTVLVNEPPPRHTSAPVAALIFAGGRGERFWPLSRIKHPKPLFSIDGKTTLLDGAIARARTVAPREHIFVIVAAEHEPAFRSALRGLIPPRNLIIEPQPRGTAVAIARGGAIIARRLGPDALIVATPADHHVKPIAAFSRAMARALKLATSNPVIVLVGVPPARADPGLGYFEATRPVGGGFEVGRFIEKPARRAAERMVRSGRFYWNAGMFVMRAATLAAELEATCPALARAVPELVAAPQNRLARLYARLDFKSFDYEVIERCAHLRCVKTQFAWHDVGSWQGLWEAMRDKSGNAFSPHVVAIKTQHVLARTAGRPMVLLGVRDLIAVDAGDVVLIADRQRSQEMRAVLDVLRRRGMSRYL